MILEPHHRNPRRKSVLKGATVAMAAALTLGLGSEVSAEAAVAATPPAPPAASEITTSDLPASDTLARGKRKKKNKKIARKLLKKRHWGKRQYRCLVKLWTKESNWNHRAANPWSGAYGIPQALPGRKMKSAGRDWRTNPKTQIRWGLRYLKSRYKNPCGGWRHFKSVGWY